MSKTNYIDTKEAARRLGVSARRVRQLLLKNRVKGARLVKEFRGATWYIPDNDGARPEIKPGMTRTWPQKDS